MIVLDAYALVALLGDEPAADAVSAMLGSGGCRISAINLAEAVHDNLTISSKLLSLAVAVQSAPAAGSP